MSRKKAADDQGPAGAAEAAAPEGADAVPREKTNTELVQECLDERGLDTKPVEIQKWLQARHGKYLKTTQISTIKTTIKSRARGEERPESHESPVESREEEGEDNPANVTFEEIRFLKRLINRLGRRRFHELVDLLS